MSSGYQIELCDPSVSMCECCGGLTVRHTRFVNRDDNTIAVYYVAYSNGHANEELSLLISLGDWTEHADPAQRAAFYCRVRPTEDSYQVMLGDAEQSPWRDVRLLGALLSRDEARAHPWKDAAFEVLDEVLERDVSVRGFLQRVECGDTSVPLEKSYQQPDEVFNLGEQRNVRAQIGKSFVVLDGLRFFVRCLLPVQIEGYDSWNIGLWIEVSKRDFGRIRDVWSDPAAYVQLRFSGAIANDVAADLELPIRRGSMVELGVSDGDAPPFVQASLNAELGALLSTTWSKADFEKYAVAHGFL